MTNNTRRLKKGSAAAKKHMAELREKGKKANTADQSAEQAEVSTEGPLHAFPNRYLVG